MEIRQTYLATAAVAVELLGDAEVAARWDGASVLADLSLGGLASHLGRAVLQVDVYLDAPVPEGRPIGAAVYYARLAGTRDLGSPLNVGVRERSAQLAARGHGAVLAEVAASLEHLRGRLPAEPAERRLEALGHVLTLDDYLRTRVVELVVHIDDLAASLGRPTPELPEPATESALQTLVGVAGLVHGPLPVLRAMARRERQGPEVLQIL